MLGLKTISIDTVWKWLKYLGYRYCEVRRSYYTDGHERQDVYDSNPNVLPCYDADGNEMSHDPSFGWSAGAIVSTASDVARWAVALFTDDVLSPASLELMTTPVLDADGDQYALGAFVESNESDTIYGHTGGYRGCLTYMYFHESSATAVVAMTNQEGTNLRDPPMRIGETGGRVRCRALAGSQTDWPPTAAAHNPS